jgi:hypothetical protein
MILPKDNHLTDHQTIESLPNQLNCVDYRMSLKIQTQILQKQQFHPRKSRVFSETKEKMRILFASKLKVCHIGGDASGSFSV